MKFYEGKACRWDWFKLSVVAFFTLTTYLVTVVLGGLPLSAASGIIIFVVIVTSIHVYTWARRDS